MNTAKKDMSGFTLTELAVTIAIIGILVMLAIPNFKDIPQRYRFDGAVRNLASELALTRLKAINQNLEYRLTVAGDGRSYLISEGNLSDASTSFTFKEQYGLPSGVNIYLTELLPGSAATFNTDGSLDVASPSDDVGRIFLQGATDALKRKIEINSHTGRVSVFRWMGGAWKDERDLNQTT